MKQTILLFAGLLLFATVISGGLLGGDGPSGDGTQATMTDPTSVAEQTLQLRTLIASTVAPTAVQPTPTSGTTCTSGKLAVDLLLDTSGSMGPDQLPPVPPSEYKINFLKSAISAFAQKLESTDVIGIQAFNSTSYPVLPLGLYNSVAFQQAVTYLQPFGTTNMRAGLTLAKTQIEVAKNSYPSPEYKWYMILVSDGLPNVPNQVTGNPFYSPDVVEPIRSLGVTIITIGFGQDADPTLLQQIASTKPNSTEKFYYFSPPNGQLETIYNDIAADICI